MKFSVVIVYELLNDSNSTLCFFLRWSLIHPLNGYIIMALYSGLSVSYTFVLKVYNPTPL